MKKIIAVDVDDVVANLVHEWLRLYNFEYGDTLSEEDIKTWSIGSYTRIGDEMYEYLNIPELYNRVFPIVDSRSGVDTLRRLGFRVVFVTASNTKQS